MMVSVKHNLRDARPRRQSEHVRLGSGIVGGIEFFVMMCQACGFGAADMPTGGEAIAEWQRRGFSVMPAGSRARTRVMRI